MTGPACSRRWQVEAARDGRLSGKDLELAERHREQCAECAGEKKTLATLTHGLSSLPSLPRDPLSVRRTRQQLMAAVNEFLVLAPPRRPWRWAAALLLLPCAAIGYAFSMHGSASRTPPAMSKSAVEVNAKPGARWVVHSTAELERVELTEGEATFKVRSHAPRRVLIQLPDGELEDLGTTFEVAVHDQHTTRIAVSDGRVAVRLATRPEFLLTAGEHWEPAPNPSALPPSPVASATSSLTNSRSDPARAAGLPRRAAVRSETSARAAEPKLVPSSAPHSEATLAEDLAYLGVVSLLRQGRQSEAREQAKAYLLRFPSGFRRIEMLDVATRSDGTPQAR